MSQDAENWGVKNMGCGVRHTWIHDPISAAY